MNKRTKGKISLFLSMAVLTSMLSLPTYAADSAVAVNMNIESYTGDVMLKKSDGKKLTVKEKLRLYSGNVLSTELKSYVIINLDDKKAVKLDEKSKVIVKKKNKKQELLVEEGNLFFNIKEKLADDEVLEIRTSTMVTGIRGTSGYVITDDKGNSTLYILDGEVTIQYEDPVTHEKREVTISGGQSAQLNNTTNENGEIISSEMLVSAILPNELPPYVALELLEDDALQERIHGDTGWLVKEIAESAKKNLQAAQDENAKREETAQNENSTASENHGAANGDGQGGAVDPLFPDGKLDNPPVPPPATTIAPPPDNPTPPTTPTPPTNPSTPPTNPPTPPTPPTPPPVPPTETVLTGAVTSAQLKAAFATDKPELVVLNSADITLSEPVTVPMGKKLELRLGINKISGNELTVSGEMSINAAASAEINSKLTVGTGLRGRAALQSTLNIYGNITYTGISPEDVLITNNGTVNIYSGTINAGIAIGIKNETPTAAISMTGGTVKSEHITIDNSVGTLNFTNGVVENTCPINERADTYAVKGNIALPQGYVYSDSFCVKAKNLNYLCNSLPSGYEVASHTTGFHLRPIINTVTLKGASLTQTDLERAFKGEQIGSINAENIKTVVLDSTSFALTANAEVPANKTLVVNGKATFSGTTDIRLIVNGAISVNSGANITVNCLLENHGNITYTGDVFNDVVITNSGKIEMRSGTIDSGAAIGIKNATDTAAISMTGGTVKSEHIAIDNSVGTLSFTNGVVENTCPINERANTYAVKGNIALPQGYVYSDSFCIKAKNPTYLCNTLPSGYEVASHTTGFHLRPIINTVTLKGASLTQTDLDSAFKGEQIGSINAENIKTVVLDSTSFALTANAEVPANKTLVVNGKATFSGTTDIRLIVNGAISVNSGANITVNCLLENHGNITYTGDVFNDVVITNSGKIEMVSGTINAGVAIAVKNASGTAAISMTGGTVKSEHIAIDNSVGTLSFTNGVIENTCVREASDAFAVNGNIALPQGYVYSDSFCVKANNPTYLCNTLPSGYEVASHTTGFHLRPIINTVTLKGAGLTQADLERAFRGEQIGSIHTENIKTVVLDNAGFALTANTEVPANKTLVVNGKATFSGTTDIRLIVNGAISVNSGANITVNCLLENHGNITYTGDVFNDVVITNNGKIEMRSGTIDAKAAIGIQNSDASAIIAMTGGTVKSEHVAIDVTVGALQFSKGIIENTYAGADTANRFALKGNAEFAGINGTDYGVIAKREALLWDKIGEHSSFGSTPLPPDRVYLSRTTI